MGAEGFEILHNFSLCGILSVFEAQKDLLSLSRPELSSNMSCWSLSLYF